MNSIKIKRIYQTPSPGDGYRMLVDRLWPRGVKKETALINEWNKDLAPSIELRKWFDHKPENFDRFAVLYKAELANKPAALKRIKSITTKQNLTLLYAAKNENVNHAKVLLDVLLEKV